MRHDEEGGESQDDKTTDNQPEIALTGTPRRVFIWVMIIVLIYGVTLLQASISSRLPTGPTIGMRAHPGGMGEIAEMVVFRYLNPLNVLLSFLDAFSWFFSPNGDQMADKAILSDLDLAARYIVNLAVLLLLPLVVVVRRLERSSSKSREQA